MFLPFFDPTYLMFALPALAIMLFAQLRVRKAYGKYSQERNTDGATGAETARRLLDSVGLNDVGIEMVPGELSDHYDPKRRIVRLSDHVHNSPSVAAIGIAAHEVGHAMQHHLGYAPLRLRSGLVPLVSLGSWLGYILFAMGFVVQLSGLTWLGITLFSGAVLFALITLPVEYNASGRAMQMLQTNGMVGMVERDGARQVLNAAALTYIAALLQTVGQLIYWVLLASGVGKRNE